LEQLLRERLMKTIDPDEFKRDDAVLIDQTPRADD